MSFEYTSSEMMSITAARALTDNMTCFVGKGPTVVITDLCILRPDPATKELIVVSLHPGVTQEDVIEATGWEIQFSDNLETTPAPSSLELKVLRELKERTQRQHANQE